MIEVSINCIIKMDG